MVKSSVSGSGPSRAMPGTSCGSRTTYIARLLRVPASVMSRPDWSSRTTRTASVDLVLGLGGIVGTSSRQRTQPGSGEVEAEVQAGGLDVEELAVPGDPVDHRALERGQRRVEGLQGAERGDVDLDDRVPVEPAPQVEGQRFHLGQLGHGASLGRIS